jgi:hypothetical protein
VQVRSALSDRTYDRIFTRAQERVSWAQRTPLTAHVLRHAAVTAVERVAGPAPGTPEWLVERVVKTVVLDRAEVASMTPDEAMSVLENHWSTR